MVKVKTKPTLKSIFKKPEKQKRYVATRNIDKMKAFGWKEAKTDYKDMGLASAATTAVQSQKDLILMEK